MAKKPKRRLSEVTRILRTAAAVQARNLKGMCRLCRSRHQRSKKFGKRFPNFFLGMAQSKQKHE